MTRLVRDYVEVEDHLPLDRLIDVLAGIRDRLPDGSQDVEVKMRGDDLVGRKLSVTFLRPLNTEELARDARYNQALRFAA